MIAKVVRSVNQVHYSLQHYTDAASEATMTFTYHTIVLTWTRGIKYAPHVGILRIVPVASQYGWPRKLRVIELPGT